MATHRFQPNHKFQILTACAVVLTLGIFFISYKHTDIEPEAQQITQLSLPTTNLFFAGDIMLSRNVAKKIYESNNYSLPFEQVKDVIQQATISFANLESPFNDTGIHSKEGSLVFNADPQSIAGLKDAGFDVLSTANNHAFDQGLKGLDYTNKLLKDHGILPTGTISSTADSTDPAVIVKNKVAFGFLSYSYTAKNDGGKTISPNVNDFNDLEKLKQDIWAMRGHYADVVIVNMHAGTEYTRTPTAKQIAFAHAAIDAGADLVVGHHPHWIQTTEEYKGKWIFYSLGNFIFDQMFSAETRQGLTLLVTYENTDIKKIELKPVVIDNYCCARWADKEEAKNILEKINLTSPILLDKNE
jgi:poly-gamma-glutamate synthesis protein (capsule biosynthesis protein)